MAQHHQESDENFIDGPSTSLLHASPVYQLQAEPIPSESEHLPSYAQIHPNQRTPWLRDHGIQHLPAYTDHLDPVAELSMAISSGVDPEHKQERDLAAWKKFVARTSGPEPSKRVIGKDIVARHDGSGNPDRQIISSFFAAIHAGHEDVVEYIVEQGLVSANTTLSGKTPLIRAVETKNVAMVKKLLDLGASVDAFSTVPSTLVHSVHGERVQRTALQLAAETGHLILVKLLIEQYSADDALIAPDGQIALRLAAENGHREVVDYLPVRRGGGFRRWKHKNRAALGRAKRACVRIGSFGKFFLWDIEKLLLWTTPKHLIVKPLVKLAKWCWEHKGEVGPWLAREFGLMPGRMRAFGIALVKVPKAIWMGMRKVLKVLWDFVIRVLPKLIKDASMWTWRFLTVHLPEALVAIAKWVWRFLTVQLPKALGFLVKWLWNGIVSTAKGTWNMLLKIVSFFSTIFEAIVSFFGRLTLADIWNGFCAVLEAVFVSFPQTLWSWIKKFEDVSYKIMKAMFGVIGEILWFIGVGILALITYVPKQLGRIVQSIGDVLGRAGYEIRVWFNPKAR